MGERVIPCPFCGGPGAMHVCPKMRDYIVGVGQSERMNTFFFSSVSDPTNYDFPKDAVPEGELATLVGAWEGDMNEVKPGTPTEFVGHQYRVPVEIAKVVTALRESRAKGMDKIAEEAYEAARQYYAKHYNVPVSVDEFVGTNAACADHWVNPISGRCKTCGESR